MNSLASALIDDVKSASGSWQTSSLNFDRSNTYLLGMNTVRDHLLSNYPGGLLLHPEEHSKVPRCQVAMDGHFLCRTDRDRISHAFLSEAVQGRSRRFDTLDCLQAGPGHYTMTFQLPQKWPADTHLAWMRSPQILIGHSLTSLH